MARRIKNSLFAIHFRLVLEGFHKKEAVEDSLFTLMRETQINNRSRHHPCHHRQGLHLSSQEDRQQCTQL